MVCAWDLGLIGFRGEGSGTAVYCLGFWGLGVWSRRKRLGLRAL